jgi:hypothetical protein
MMTEELKGKENFEDIGLNGRIILWHVDPLLSNDREMSNYTIAVTK